MSEAFFQLQKTIAEVGRLQASLLLIENQQLRDENKRLRAENERLRATLTEAPSFYQDAGKYLRGEELRAEMQQGAVKAAGEDKE